MALMCGLGSLEWSFSVNTSWMVDLPASGSSLRAETKASLASLPSPVNLPETGGSAAAAGPARAMTNRAQTGARRGMGDLGWWRWRERRDTIQDTNCLRALARAAPGWYPGAHLHRPPAPPAPAGGPPAPPPR